MLRFFTQFRYRLNCMTWKKVLSLDIEGFDDGNHVKEAGEETDRVGPRTSEGI